MFSLLTMVLLALGSQLTHAQGDQDFILSQSYYLDKTNSLSYDSAMSADFKPYKGMLTGGFNNGAYWVRLDIRANAQDLALKIRPSFTNEITLYDPASSDSPRATGSNYPVKAADIQTNSLNFVLPPSTENRAVYLRIKSVSSYLLYVEAMPLAEFQRTERSDNLIYTGYLMLTLILAVWMFITWLMHRERVIGVFALQQFIAVLHTFSRVGFSRSFLDYYLSDALISQISNGIVVFYVLVGMIVNKLLLQEYGMKRIFRYIFNATIACSMGIVVMYLSGHQQTALSINAPLVLFLHAWFLICALWGIDASKAAESAAGFQIKVLRIFYAFNFLVWIIAMLPLLGIISTGPIALHSLLVYNITSSLVFFILLQYRARCLLRNEVARASTLEAEATQERQRREEQSMMMAMLSHEIKTPLSILKLIMDKNLSGANLKVHANRAVSNIDFIVNRCLQLVKLDSEAINLKPSNFQTNQFLMELAQDSQDAGRVKIGERNRLCLHADKAVLRVVVSNLIENGLKYGDIAQPVKVDILEEPKSGADGTRINVRNAIGILGIPDADQVFKKYYRNTQATKVAGSGLGLFIVDQLVKIMGGEVTYSCKNDEVLFSVWLPG